MWKMTKSAPFVLLPLLSIGLIIIIAAFIVSPEAKTGDGHSLKIFLFAMGGLYLIGPFALIGILMLSNMREAKKIEYFKENGIQGIAKIISYQTTGTEVNNMPQIEFIFEITSDFLESYQIKYVQLVDLINLGKLHKGLEIPILIDPENQKKILPIWDCFD